ncbi:MAG: cation diffusion facilitator family transporter [Polyangiaceae bacterium]|nr:cation diffusion facilitator family transporter [Polyangiaceae bacterium]
MSAELSHVSLPSPTERKQAKRLSWVLVLIAVFFVFEFMGAKAARSDVLEADALHLLMDVFAMGISLVAMKVASARPNSRFTFGMRRAESMAALVNGILVVGVAIELVRDAVRDLGSTTQPKSELLLLVASAALVVNGVSAWLLHGVMGHTHAHAHEHEHGHERGCEHAHEHGDAHAHGENGEHDEHHADAHGHHLNLRGAWLHLLGDALGSLAAFVAGLAMRVGAPAMVDPLASLFVVAILLVGAARLLRDAGMVLLEAVPMRLSVATMKRAILEHPGVIHLHALHIWSLGTGHDAVTVHILADGSDPALSTRINDFVRARFHVKYVTVQVDVEAGRETA